MTKLEITNHNGIRLAKLAELEIAPGSQVLLTAQRGAATAIYLDKETASALLPPVSDAKILVEPGKCITLTFGSVEAVAYSLVLQSPDLPAPVQDAQKSSRDKAVLVVSSVAGSSFPAPGVDTQDLAGTVPTGGN